MKRSKLYFGIFFIYILTSCSLFEENPSVTFDKATFDQNYAVWSEKSFNNYSFTYDLGFDNTKGYNTIGDVTVVDGVGSVNFDKTEDMNTEFISEAEYSRMLNYITSMEDVFDLILSSYESFKERVELGTSHYSSGDYQITYDETYKSPISAKNNYTLKDDIVGDSGLDIRISDLVIIN